MVVVQEHLIIQVAQQDQADLVVVDVELLQIQELELETLQ
jgi:hypothetical protein